MLYLGHFNLIYEAKVGRKQSQVLDGSFTSVAEAESAEEAAVGPAWARRACDALL